MSPRIIQCEQGSEDWFRARMGIPTSSEFKTLLGIKKEAKEKVTRQTYLLKLAGEILTDKPMEGNYKSADMERGNAMEDEARDFYSFMSDAELTRIGFIRNGNTGCSPDSLIGNNGILEIKTAFPHILAALILKDDFPPEHKAQCQGNLWVAEREYIDISVFWPRMPRFVKRAYRDEAYIKELSAAVDQFNDELHETVERLRRYGEAKMPADLLMAG